MDRHRKIDHGWGCSPGFAISAARMLASTARMLARLLRPSRKKKGGDQIAVGTLMGVAGSADTSVYRYKKNGGRHLKSIRVRARVRDVNREGAANTLDTIPKEDVGETDQRRQNDGWAQQKQWVKSRSMYLVLYAYRKVNDCNLSQGVVLH